MSGSSFSEQFEICRKTLDGLDEAGAKIDRLAGEYDNMVGVMRQRGYVHELQSELERMNAEFQNEIEALKRQLFDENMKYVHAQGTQLKNAMASRG